MVTAERASVRGLARELNVAPAAIRLAVRSGRISETAIARDRRGHLVVLDALLAAREWRAHTRPRIDSRKPTTATPREPDNLASPPVAALLDLRAVLAGLHERSDKLLQASARQSPSAPAAQWEKLFADWARIPDVLARLEDGMRAAGVPLLEKDMQDMPGPQAGDKETGP